MADLEGCTRFFRDILTLNPCYYISAKVFSVGLRAKPALGKV